MPVDPSGRYKGNNYNPNFRHKNQSNPKHGPNSDTGSSPPRKRYHSQHEPQYVKQQQQLRPQQLQTSYRTEQQSQDDPLILNYASSSPATNSSTNAVTYSQPDGGRGHLYETGPIVASSNGGEMFYHPPYDPVAETMRTAYDPHLQSLLDLLPNDNDRPAMADRPPPMAFAGNNNSHPSLPTTQTSHANPSPHRPHQGVTQLTHSNDTALAPTLLPRLPPSPVQSSSKAPAVVPLRPTPITVPRESEGNMPQVSPSATDQAQHVVVPESAVSSGELNSLEKLKRFKAQVEATRLAKAGSSPRSAELPPSANIARVAQSFLQSHAEKLASVKPLAIESVPTVATSSSAVEGDDAPVTGQSADSAGVEDGEIVETPRSDREKQLREQLKLKLSKNKAGTLGLEAPSPLQSVGTKRPMENPQAVPANFKRARPHDNFGSPQRQQEQLPPAQSQQTQQSQSQQQRQQPQQPQQRTQAQQPPLQQQAQQRPPPQQAPRPPQSPQPPQPPQQLQPSHPSQSSQQVQLDQSLLQRMQQSPQNQHQLQYIIEEQVPPPTTEYEHRRRPNISRQPDPVPTHRDSSRPPQMSPTLKQSVYSDQTASFADAARTRARKRTWELGRDPEPPVINGPVVQMPAPAAASNLHRSRSVSPRPRLPPQSPPPSQWMLTKRNTPRQSFPYERELAPHKEFARPLSRNQHDSWNTQTREREHTGSSQHRESYPEEEYQPLRRRSYEGRGGHHPPDRDTNGWHASYVAPAPTHPMPVRELGPLREPMPVHEPMPVRGHLPQSRQVSYGTDTRRSVSNLNSSKREIYPASPVREIAPPPDAVVQVQTPTSNWVVRTLQLLKAQIAELEKLVEPTPLALASATVPVPAQQPAPMPVLAPVLPSSPPVAAAGRPSSAFGIQERVQTYRPDERSSSPTINRYPAERYTTEQYPIEGYPPDRYAEVHERRQGQVASSPPIRYQGIGDGYNRLDEIYPAPASHGAYNGTSRSRPYEYGERERERDSERGQVYPPIREQHYSAEEGYSERKTYAAAAPRQVTNTNGLSDGGAGRGRSGHVNANPRPSLRGRGGYTSVNPRNGDGQESAPSKHIYGNVNGNHSGHYSGGGYEKSYTRAGGYGGHGATGGGRGGSSSGRYDYD